MLTQSKHFALTACLQYKTFTVTPCFDIAWYGKEYEGLIFEIRFTFAVFTISLFIQKDKTDLDL
jgi:hypothetical protein